MPRAAAELPSSVNFAQDAYEALPGADACLILTEWEDFAALDLARVKKLLRYPIVIDGRNLFKPAQMEAAGLNYYSVGRPDVVGERRTASRKLASLQLEIKPAIESLKLEDAVNEDHAA